MKLTYDQKQTYQCICDPKGYCICCYVLTITDVYSDGVYMASSTKTQEIHLDKMKNIISELKFVE